MFQRGAPGDGGRAGGCAAAAEGALLRGRRRRAGHRRLVHRVLQRNPDAGTKQTFTSDSLSVRDRDSVVTERIKRLNILRFPYRKDENTGIHNGLIYIFH